MKGLNSEDDGRHMRVVVLMPVFNDWDAAAEVVKRLRTTLVDFSVSILLINDGSSLKPNWHPSTDGSKLPVSILHLRRNIGHQRAIAVGLTWIYEHIQGDAVLVMDADGEDTPEEALKLLLAFQKGGGDRIIFAERYKRAEGLMFRILYRFYRFLHLLLTGIPVRVGNFSVLPFSNLSTLVILSELWNHYVAAVFKSKLPFSAIPTSRGVRLAGKSKMNLVSLVTHGLSAIAVFGETVTIRLLFASAAAAALFLALIAIVVSIRIGTNQAIPGWATNAGGILMLALLQVITVGSILTFSLLASRQNLSFLPLRDYSWFVSGVEHLDVPT